MDDTTEKTAPASETHRELTSWERRLFDGVRMVSREDRAAIAEAARRRLEGSPHDLSPRWYGQRLSGTDGNS
ncbi:hypothetical protein [Streptomyces sp. bgisy126]|uniref:hypothetical protein n=1 Tax=unclassified Streptomyces TaxID=2593676 RepID=UPI003EBF5EAC